MSTTPVPAPAFPGRVIKAGSSDAASVTAIQKKLNQLGCGPVDEDGGFGAETMEAVQLFQMRFVDSRGLPLEVDGKVGPATWGALFGAQAIAPAVAASGPLTTEALRVAGAEVGVMEVPPGSNRGPRVDEYLHTVGLNPAGGSFAWCAAFIYWSFQKAAESLNVPNPAVRTAGALDLWNQAGRKGVKRVAAAEAADTPSLVKPGMVFVLSSGGGHGHVGMVEKVDGVVLTTIEGNTNDGGSREGIGVFRRTGRKISQINMGFVEHSA